MAEWSKAPRSGRGPKGRGFESHFCYYLLFFFLIVTIHSLATTSQLTFLPIVIFRSQTLNNAVKYDLLNYSKQVVYYICIAKRAEPLMSNMKNIISIAVFTYYT